MKHSLQTVYDLASSWNQLSPTQAELLLTSLTSADADTVARDYHLVVQRNYAKARRSVMWSLIGIFLTVALGIPGLYFYYHDQRERDRLVAARLRDAGNLMEDHQFQAA